MTMKHIPSKSETLFAFFLINTILMYFVIITIN